MAIWAGVLGGLFGFRGGAALAADALSFESLAGAATRITEIGTLVRPLVDDCSAARREIDKSRCRGVRAHMRKRLPQRSFVVVVDDPQVISVSEYDARIKGFRVRVAGCLACKQPVVVGAEKRFITLKAPSKGATATSLVTSVDVTEGNVTFLDVAESQAWTATVRPHLRAEFIFKPSEAEWTLGTSRGYAFAIVGARAFNACTGDVIVSQPPSVGPAASDPDGCSSEEQPVARASEAGGDEEAVPETLTTAAINAALARVREDADACFAQFRMKGTAFLDFDVQGTGGTYNVTLDGTLSGTAMGMCVVDAARKIQFPQFKVERQKFRYPVVFTGSAAR